MGSLVEHQPYKGNQTTVRVAAGVLPPVAQTVTLGAQAAAAATSLTVTALTEPIEKGNWLLFTDEDGLEYLAKVTADAADGATTLTVAALYEAIPNAATAKFPSELLDRSAIDVERSYDTQDIYTLNTGGERQLVAVTSSKSASAPGFWHWFNAGYRICEDIAEAKKTVWLAIEYEPPTPTATKGEIHVYKCVITGMPKTSPADNFMQGDIDFEMTGPPRPVVPPVFA